MKTFQRTGLFALFVVGLAVASYFLVYEGDKRKIAAKEKAAILVNYPADQVTELTFETEGRKLNLKKVNGAWQITSPLQYPASNDEAQSFVDSILREHSIEELRDDPAVQWSVFGLDKPAGSVTIVGPGGQSRKLLISTRKTYSGDLYLRFENENKLLLVGSVWNTHLNKDVKSLRDKQILFEDPQSFEHIAVKSNRGSKPVSFRLSKKEGKWELDGNSQVPIDSSEVKKFLDALKNLKAVEFHDEQKRSDAELKKFNLAAGASNQIDLQIELSGPATAQVGGAEKTKPAPAPFLLKIGKPTKDSKVYLMSSALAPVFEVAKNQTSELASDLSDFRNKALPFEYKYGEARSLSYRSSLFSADFVSEGGKWRLKDPQPDKEVRSDLIDGLLRDIQGLRAVKYLGQGNFKGLNPPKGSVEVKGEKGELLIHLKWGGEFPEKSASGAKLVYASTSLSPEGLAIEEAKVSRLPGQTLVVTKEKPAEKPAEKLAEKSAEKTAENAAEKSAEKKPQKKPQKKPEQGADAHP